MEKEVGRRGRKRTWLVFRRNRVPKEVRCGHSAGPSGRELKSPCNAQCHHPRLAHPGFQKILFQSLSSGCGE